MSDQKEKELMETCKANKCETCPIKDFCENPYE